METLARQLEFLELPFGMRNGEHKMETAQLELWSDGSFMGTWGGCGNVQVMGGRDGTEGLSQLGVVLDDLVGAVSRISCFIRSLSH